jgi:hypothetical protein
LLLCNRYRCGTYSFVLLILRQFSAGFVRNIGLLDISRCLDRLAEQMLGLAVSVLFTLNLKATIALLASEEIVVLTSTAHPPILRELELILKS